MHVPNISSYRETNIIFCEEREKRKKERKMTLMKKKHWKRKSYLDKITKKFLKNYDAI